MDRLIEYHRFLESKRPRDKEYGFTPYPIHGPLFGYQRDCVEWAVHKGRAALFLDTGLGKTICQLEWAEQCIKHSGLPALLLCPLAVQEQTHREADRFGYNARVCKTGDDIGPGINITNYHRLEHFNPAEFGSVVLDESSILKSFTGTTKRELVETFARTPYRLCCSATPAPNDYMELGNHSEFLGVMPMVDMLCRWFIVDSNQPSKYTMKGHAVDSFWCWVASWAVCATSPADLGHPEEVSELPPLKIIPHEVISNHSIEDSGTLFPNMEVSATNINQTRRASIDERCAMSAKIAKSTKGSVIVWCHLNDESNLLADLIPGAEEIVGSESPEVKAEKLQAFTDGKIRVLVTKPSIAGFGLNWQHCNTMVFASLSYSYEQFYQAIRRCWRYGQTKPVNVHVVTSDAESGVVEAIERKRDDHRAMLANMKTANFANRSAVEHLIRIKYEGDKSPIIPAWLKESDL
jgi:superfamily II DNA or RNA helicase